MVRLRNFLHRRIPRQHHLRDTWLHRRLGERMFDPTLWKPDRARGAAGFALGLFVGMTPTMGFQILLTVILAYFLRVNIPLGVLACFITNPITAPLIYPAEIWLGQWLIGLATKGVLAPPEAVTRHIFRYAAPLSVGSLVTAVVAAAVGYFALYVAWGWVKRINEQYFHIHFHHDHPHPPPPADPPPEPPELLPED